MTGDEEKPTWWEENQRLRDEMGLAEYVPPRFSDGAYVHDVVSELERRHERSIQFVGLDPRYPDDWHVRVDGNSVFEIGRHRDENGNTVYEMPSDEFRDRLESELSSHRS